MSAPGLPSTTTSAIRVTATGLWASPDAPRTIDAPLVAEVPDPRTWPDGLDKDARLDLKERILTQLLLGEPVDVLEERGDWLQVVAPWQLSSRDRRGYPGWVPRAHVGAAPTAAEREAVVAVEAAPVRATPGGTPAPDAPSEASYATILPVLDETPAGVRVCLPGGHSAWLDPSACVVRPAGVERPVDGQAVLAAARRFVGLDYIWGGMSAFGLDCSGLVHLSFRALGRVVPRDADDQATAASVVPLGQARPGDLYFFARPGQSIHHVGFVAGGDRMLHAPRTGQTVVEEQIDGDRRATLVSDAGRLVDHN